MNDESGDHGRPSQSPLNIDSVGGNVIVVEQRREPEIPEGKGRTCPQCRRCAWKQSRFCWNCKFDFDRAELPRCHPRKLLVIAVSIISATAVAVLICHLNVIRRQNPTSASPVSSPTPPLALAGTLEVRLGTSSMTEKRKVDVSGIWAQRPSADILETRRTQQRAAAPLVSVGQVHGNVITINSAAGLDLTQLLGRGGRPEGETS